MRKLFSTRRRLAIAAAITALALAGGTAAYAYFTDTGSGIGSASVGSASPWTVAETSSTGGPLYPGGTGIVDITFTVTNAGQGYQELTNVDPTILNDGTTPTPNVEEGPSPSPTPVPSCLAPWFSTEVVSTSETLPYDVAPAGSVTVVVSVTMPQDDSDNQDACEGIDGPDVTLSAS